MTASDKLSKSIYGVIADYYASELAEKIKRGEPKSTTQPIEALMLLFQNCSRKKSEHDEKAKEE